MAGSLSIEVPEHLQGDGSLQEALVQEIRAEVRQRGEAENIPLPRNMRCGGMYGAWIGFSYTTRAHKNLLVRVLQGRGLKIREKL